MAPPNTKEPKVLDTETATEERPEATRKLLVDAPGQCSKNTAVAQRILPVAFR